MKQKIKKAKAKKKVANKGFVPVNAWLAKGEKRAFKKYCKKNHLDERWEARDAILQRMKDRNIKY